MEKGYRKEARSNYTNFLQGRKQTERRIKRKPLKVGKENIVGKSTKEESRERIV